MNWISAAQRRRSFLCSHFSWLNWVLECGRLQP